eukprot:jgi/Mesvir1/17111/Mv07546-RA.1
MLNGFMKAEKLRVVARGGKEQEVTKTVAAAKLEEWATDWTNFGGVDVQMLKERRASQGRRGRRRRQGRGAEETDKWGPDQKNFMQRWLFWCEDPLKPVVDGKPAIAQDIAARQDFLDARPKDKAHELSIFTAHRELASFQYFDSLIQAPIMSCEAPPSNLIKIMEVAKNLKEAAVQFAHIKFLENPLMAACKQLDGTFDPVLVREHVFGVKLKGTFATDLDKFIADCRLTRDFWRVVVTATRAIILTLRDLPPAKRKVVDQKDWKFPRGLLASHPRHLYDDLGVKTKHLLEKTYEELMAEAAAAQGQKAKRRGGGRRGAGQETEGADEPSQPQKGGGQGRDGGGLPVAEKGAVCTAVDPIRDVEPDVRMRFMDGAKLGRGGWTSKWVEDMWLNWQHKYPKKEDFLLFGTLLGREKEKVVIRWFDEGYELGRSDESERRFRFPLKFASEHVTLLKEGASWDNIPSHRPGKR